jgi:hypothetical protein
MQDLNITPETRQAYESLSAANIKFLEYTLKKPGFLSRSRFQELVAWKHPTSNVQLQPWPLFIDRHTRDTFEEAAVKVFNLVKSIPRRVFSFDPYRIGDYYHIPGEQVKGFMPGTSERHIEGLLGRGDFVFSPSGLKCLEFNATSLGGWQLPTWEALALQNLLIAEFIDIHHLKINNKNLFSALFDHLIGIAREFFPQEDEINIAIVIFHPGLVASMGVYDRYLNHLYLAQLQTRNQEKRVTGRIMFCTFQQMRITNDCLYYQNQKIHIIIDYSDREISPEFLSTFKPGNVLIFNGPVSNIIANKFCLSLLSELEDSELFGFEERKTIKEHIPWTRKMSPGLTTYKGEEINLEDFVRANREQLVLKPAIGHGGEGVIIGGHSHTGEWQEMVTGAFHQRRWIVQERIQSHRFLFQWGENGCEECEAALGMFVYGSKLGGVFMRILPRDHSKGVINAIQGAETPIVLEVQEQLIK